MKEFLVCPEFAGTQFSLPTSALSSPNSYFEIEDLLDSPPPYLESESFKGAQDDDSVLGFNSMSSPAPGDGLQADKIPERSKFLDNSDSEDVKIIPVEESPAPEVLPVDIPAKHLLLNMILQDTDLVELLAKSGLTRQKLLNLTERNLNDCYESLRNVVCNELVKRVMAWNEQMKDLPSDECHVLTATNNINAFLKNPLSKRLACLGNY